MDSINKIDLSKVRLEHAKESLFAAKVLLEVESYKDAANRSYYAIFHAMRAVLALDGIDMKSHKGIMSEFRKLYIKTNIFPKEISDIINNLFKIRMNTDYEDFYIVVKQEVRDQFTNAEFFIKEIEKFLKGKYK